MHTSVVEGEELQGCRVCQHSEGELAGWVRHAEGGRVGQLQPLQGGKTQAVDQRNKRACDQCFNDSVRESNGRTVRDGAARETQVAQRGGTAVEWGGS